LGRGAISALWPIPLIMPPRSWELLAAQRELIVFDGDQSSSPVSHLDLKKAYHQLLFPRPA